jgi:hypothetical protein
MVREGAGGATQGIWFSARVEPPSPGPYAQVFTAGFQTKVYDSYLVGHRYLYDDTHNVFLGYDLLLQPEAQTDTYRASFLELGLGALELPAIGPNQPRADAEGQWKKLPLAKYPGPQIFRIGDVISIELLTASGTRQKIRDEIHTDAMLVYTMTGTAPPPEPNLKAKATIVRSAIAPATPAAASRPSPTVAGPVREFSVEDAEMRISQFRITVNGIAETPAKSASASTGALVWFSLPNHGRYILSLTPHPALGFAKAGEVRGGVATFTLGSETIKLECPAAIAPGSSAYSLYVNHDPKWEPTAQSQRGSIQYGSVDIGELAKLVRN